MVSIGSSPVVWADDAGSEDAGSEGARSEIESTVQMTVSAMHRGEPGVAARAGAPVMPHVDAAC
jgi:hypothetical protein